MSKGADIVFETDDLALSAFLLMRKVELRRYTAEKGKLTMYFEDENGKPTESGGHPMSRCQTLHVEFLNSECKRFDSFVRDIKKMLRGT